MNAEKLSLRPYLLRAVHEWITDRGDTPQVVVQAGSSPPPPRARGAPKLRVVR